MYNKKIVIIIILILIILGLILIYKYSEKFSNDIKIVNCDKYPYLCSNKNNNQQYESYPLLIKDNIIMDNLLEIYYKFSKY